MSKTKNAPQSAFPRLGGHVACDLGRKAPWTGWLGVAGTGLTPPCCLSGPRPAEERASQSGRGWQFPWKSSPAWLRALQGRGRGDTHLKPAKVGGGSLARPCEASQVGRSRRGSISARRDQVKRRPPGTIATFVPCGGSETPGVIKSAQAGDGERSRGRWRTWHPGGSVARPDPDTHVSFEEQSRCCCVPQKDPWADNGLLQVLPCRAPSRHRPCALSARGRPFHRPDHLAGGGPRELRFADGQPRPRLEGCCRSGAHLTSGPPRDVAGRGRTRQGPLRADRARPASAAQRAPCKICRTVCWPSATGLHK